MSRLLLFSVAAILVPSGSFSQIATPSGYQLRGFLGVALSEPDPGADFRIIRAVDSDSPACRAGITRGDYIVSVDGRSTAGLKSKDELLNVLRGDPGTTVRLELLSASTSRLDTLIITRVERLLPIEPSR